MYLYKGRVGGVQRRGGTISVVFYRFVLCYNSNFIKKTFIQRFFLFKTKNNTWNVQIFYNLQNHPTFRSEEWLVNLGRGKECFAGLSILFVFVTDT